MKNQNLQLNLIYLDNHLLVANKPAGLLVQGDMTGDPTLLDVAKRFLKKKYNKPGNVYLGLVHRLDRPVSGVVVFARTSKAASRLSEQFRNKKIKKAYKALVRGKIAASGTLVNRIEKQGRVSRIVTGERGKIAELSFERLRYENGLSEVGIDLKTGRHHQIRVQFAAVGFPIIGDLKYGSDDRFSERGIALHADSVTISHPISKKEMQFTADLPPVWYLSL